MGSWDRQAAIKKRKALARICNVRPEISISSRERGEWIPIKIRASLFRGAPPRVLQDDDASANVTSSGSWRDEALFARTRRAPGRREGLRAAGIVLTLVFTLTRINWRYRRVVCPEHLLALGIYCLRWGHFSFFPNVMHRVDFEVIWLMNHGFSSHWGMVRKKWSENFDS